MTDRAWVTDAMHNERLMYNFWPSRTYLEENLAHEEAAMKKVRLAQRLEPTERRPNTAQIFKSVNPISPLPHIIQNGQLMVSDQVKEVMVSFDIGTTAFDPVTLSKAVGGPLGEPNYHFLNITETKESAELSESSGIWYSIGGKGTVRVRKSKVVVNRSALVGVDMWMEPVLSGAIFVSDRLYRALKDAKLLKFVEFGQCRILD